MKDAAPGDRRAARRTRRRVRALPRPALPHLHQRHRQPVHLPRLPGGRNRRHRRLSCWRRWTATSASSSTPRCSGRKKSDHLLHDVLGYREIQLHPPAFENDLQFDEALDLIPRLQRRGAPARQEPLGQVQQHAGGEESQAGFRRRADVHVGRAAARARHEPGAEVPRAHAGARSRSPSPAGWTRTTSPTAVAMNFVPVTTCTDLLRPGGYGAAEPLPGEPGRARCSASGASNIAEFVQRYRGQARRRADTAGLLNTPILVAEATANPRYALGAQPGRAAQDRLQALALRLHQLRQVRAGLPQRRQLRLRNARRKPSSTTISSCSPGAVRRIPGGVLRVVKAHQLANYADACNECGNCDVFCPEDGGPQAREAALLRQPGDLPEACRRERLLYRLGSARTIHGTHGGASGISWRSTPRRTAPGSDRNGRRSRDPSQRQRSRVLAAHRQRGRAASHARHAAVPQAQTADGIDRRSAPRALCQRGGSSGDP